MQKQSGLSKGLKAVTWEPTFKWRPQEVGRGKPDQREEDEKDKQGACGTTYTLEHKSPSYLFSVFARILHNRSPVQVRICILSLSMMMGDAVILTPSTL